MHIWWFHQQYSGWQWEKRKMADVTLEILDVFSSVWFLMYRCHILWGPSEEMSRVSFQLSGDTLYMSSTLIMVMLFIPWHPISLYWGGTLSHTDCQFLTPVFKVRVFLQVTLNFYWSKWILVVDIQTQILLTILLLIDHFSRCKLKVYIITHTKKKPFTTNWFFFSKIVKVMKVKRVSKIWARMCTTNIHLLQFKFISHLLKRGLWMPVHQDSYGTKEKPSKITNITFVILPFYQKTYSNLMAILSTFESTTLDETIICDSKWEKQPRKIYRVG